jgi:hypothetical protein
MELRRKRRQTNGGRTADGSWTPPPAGHAGGSLDGFLLDASAYDIPAYSVYGDPEPEPDAPGAPGAPRPTGAQPPAEGPDPVMLMAPSARLSQPFPPARPGTQPPARSGPQPPALVPVPPKRRRAAPVGGPTRAAALPAGSSSGARPTVRAPYTLSRAHEARAKDPLFEVDLAAIPELDNLDAIPALPAAPETPTPLLLPPAIPVDELPQVERREPRDVGEPTAQLQLGHLHEQVEHREHREHGGHREQGER